MTVCMEPGLTKLRALKSDSSNLDWNELRNAYTDRLKNTVSISPENSVRRQAASWAGLSAEIVQVVRHGRIQIRFQAPVHLLIAYERGSREEGGTEIDGLPRSTVKDMKGKLTFVPAGRAYTEVFEPRVLPELAYFYFDPACMDALPTERLPLSPRLFFEDPDIRETVSKLRGLVGCSGPDTFYANTMATALAYELVRLETGSANGDVVFQGGLAAWQERTALDYIESNLAEVIELRTLASLARLSPHHFCRAFKHSFGHPPCRYHGLRRIEKAKRLLAEGRLSVTEIALELGYSETSSFTAAFKRISGTTPSRYRRELI